MIFTCECGGLFATERDEAIAASPEALCRCGNPRQRANTAGHSVSVDGSPLTAQVNPKDWANFYARIDAAIARITSGQAAMRIPVDFTDPDVVLAECKLSIATLRQHVKNDALQLEQAREELGKLRKDHEDLGDNAEFNESQLRTALEQARTSFNEILTIHWGWDGNCGALRLAEDGFDTVAKALNESSVSRSSHALNASGVSSEDSSAAAASPRPEKGFPPVSPEKT